MLADPETTKEKLKYIWRGNGENIPTVLGKFFGKLEEGNNTDNS